jgi:hypothetical protein
MTCKLCDTGIIHLLGGSTLPKVEDHQEFGSGVEGAHYTKFEKDGVKGMVLVSMPEGTTTILTSVDAKQDLLLQAKNNVLNLLSTAIKLSTKLDQAQENFVADRLSDALEALTDQVSTPSILKSMTQEGLQETLKLMGQAKIYIKQHQQEIETEIKAVDEKSQALEGLLRQLKPE